MTIILRAGTTSLEVPLGVFLDETDGKTPETALTIANTDIKLWKHGAVSLVNKNSGGATHMAGGIYYIELDNTDTDTVGNLVIFVHVSGALPVKVECTVMAANYYDAIRGTDKLQVDAVELSGTAQTARDIGASVLVGDKTGFSLSAAGIQAIFDTLTSALTTVGSIGKLLVDNLDAAISSRLATAGYTAPLDAAGTRSAVGLASANLDTQLGNLQTPLNTLTSTIADSVPADGSRPTLLQGILMLTRFLFERSVSGTTMTVKKEDGSTTSMTFSLDDANNPTSITRAS